MGLFDDIKLNDIEPVYQQITRYVKIKIHLNQLKDGQDLPSRRELAAKIGVNPNTVQKAYKVLEDEGLLTTGNNVKSTINVTDNIKYNIRNELTENSVSEFISYAKSINLSFKDTVELITKLWDE